MKILISSQKGVSFQLRVKYTELVHTVATVISCGWNVRQINLENPHSKEVSRGLFQAWIDANHLIERCRAPEASYSGRKTAISLLGPEKDGEFAWANPDNKDFSMPTRRS